MTESRYRLVAILAVCLVIAIGSGEVEGGKVKAAIDKVKAALDKDFNDVDGQSPDEACLAISGSKADNADLVDNGCLLTCDDKFYVVNELEKCAPGYTCHNGDCLKGGAEDYGYLDLVIEKGDLIETDILPFTGHTDGFVESYLLQPEVNQRKPQAKGKKPKSRQDIGQPLSKETDGFCFTPIVWDQLKPAWKTSCRSQLIHKNTKVKLNVYDYSPLGAISQNYKFQYNIGTTTLKISEFTKKPNGSLTRELEDKNPRWSFQGESTITVRGVWIQEAPATVSHSVQDDD